MFNIPKVKFFLLKIYFLPRMENDFLDSFLGDSQFYTELLEPENLDRNEVVEEEHFNYTISLLNQNNQAIPERIAHETAPTLFSETTHSNINSLTNAINSFHPVGESTNVVLQNEPV